MARWKTGERTEQHLLFDWIIEWSMNGCRWWWSTGDDIGWGIDFTVWEDQGLLCTAEHWTLRCWTWTTIVVLQ